MGMRLWHGIVAANTSSLIMSSSTLLTGRCSDLIWRHAEHCSWLLLLLSVFNIQYIQYITTATFSDYLLLHLQICHSNNLVACKPFPIPQHHAPASRLGTRPPLFHRRHFDGLTWSFFLQIDRLLDWLLVYSTSVRKIYASIGSSLFLRKSGAARRKIIVSQK